MSRQVENVFITGSTGFIGSQLTKFLLKRGYRVNILLREDSNIENIKDIFKLLVVHKGDLSNTERLKKIITKANPSYIFHLSSYGNSSSQKDLKKMVTVNIMGLINLLEASKKIKYKSFIISGSSSEYGFKKTPMKESDFLDPNSYYSSTKGSATLLAQSFARENDKPVRILRLFSAYGPFENKERLIPTVIRKALRNENISITAGVVKRDFVYIDDVLDAFYKTMNSKLENGEIINVGTGKDSDNKEVAKIVRELLKKRIKIKVGSYPKRSWDTSYWVADTKKTKKLIKWSASVSLREGLLKTIEWNKNQDDK
jgi:nucleoside-diphosphate-sugar epimerase